MASFYAEPAVRQRLVEFLGGDCVQNATAVYLTHADGCAYDPAKLHPPRELDWFLRRNLDIARSLADTSSVLLHLDVEHVDFDSPKEPYIDPWRSFDLQEPVVKVVESLLLGWGIAALHTITGQGHHFVWQLSRDSPIAARLAELAPAPESIQAWTKRVPKGCTGIDENAERAFAGVGLLMEYVGHRIKEAAASRTAIPVEITAVHVGVCRSTKRREIVNVDISEYGDPLHTRMIRMPFTNYLKPWVNGMAQAVQPRDAIPKMATIPLHEIDVRQALKCRQVDADVRDLARRACVRIPQQETGTQHLLDEYLQSPLRRFHEFFYSVKHDPPDRWPDTYGHTPLEALPPCARHILTWPNDLLLKPAGIQLITRCLLAIGWHPRHIGGLIRSKLENPSHQWKEDWNAYDPATRADFYVRLFSGLHATGLDEQVDLNCTSNREKGFCFMPPEGGCSLAPFRKRLLETIP